MKLEHKMPAKILLVAHCIVNPYAAIHGGGNNRSLARELIGMALDNDVGVIQLPCPEMTLLGSQRWAQSFEQYDTPAFHKHCERLLETPFEQIAEHLRDGKHIVAACGIAGSPSCSVFENTSAEYGGLVPGMKDAPAELPRATKVPRQGHFMQALQRGLRHGTVHANLIELPRPDCSDETAETFRSHIAGLLER